MDVHPCAQIVSKMIVYHGLQWMYARKTCRCHGIRILKLAFLRDFESAILNTKSSLLISKCLIKAQFDTVSHLYVVIGAQRHYC